jgi:mannose-6-phosphate isomerase-like protein (cupin superfamily)
MQPTLRWRSARLMPTLASATMDGREFAAALKNKTIRISASIVTRGRIMSQPSKPMFATMQLPSHYDYLAPDGSEIRELLRGRGCNLAHCVLPAGRVSLATTHRTVEEIWYCLSGHGQIWRKLGEVEQVTDIQPGTSLSIPTGTHFQFRNTGRDALCVVIACTPPWPGAQESVMISDHWKASSA